ncbi:hypothetical protein POPTR_007G119800v4 [Populus trichocarpa]|uniref:Uncharacterized protein n=1 Tax=Populus trichocarpa TaxID=3694 RepID=A0ACC0SR04_POPTR|nr:GLABROUS1 enhancer-binding protein-like 1 [Populus trichocarpa]KAI9391649.1 hypothetical protein POPTR_007G119800v4 [Populus trichocarpa]
MARRRPFEVAPPAVSSSEEEEETDGEEETPKGTVQAQQNGTGEKQNDNENGSEDDDDDDDDDDEEEKEKPNLPPSKPSKPDSESDSETDSEDTESTQPPSPSLSGFTIKPISPKRKPGPKLEQPKKENDGEDKKAKRGAGAGGGGPQRLWSDEDEIVMLNGMVEYQIEKGKNPFADNGDFHGFVKKSLHVDATNNQFLDKIRRLKKKYFTDVEKNEKEIDEIFSKPHDLECVELAKKIWGAGGIEMGKKGNFNKKSGKNVSGGGGGGGGEGEGEGGGGVRGGGITLALAKKGNEEANGEKGKLSVKKGKRGSNEEVKVEGKEGDLKKKRQGLGGEADEGEAGNVKKGKRGLSEEVNGEGKGKGVKREKRAADEEMSGEGEEVNVIVKKQRRLVNDEINGGGMELSVKKRNAVANEELDREEAGSEDFWDKYPYLRLALDGEILPEYLKERTMLVLGMVGEEKLVELEREWRSLMKAKLEFMVMQKDLIAKQIKLSLDAMNSQDT